MADLLPPLSAAEVRVLGALVEKQITTPDYYPLSLNALTNACNQLSNREPVVVFEDSTVTQAVEGLRAKRLATRFAGQESRVAKYKHTLTDALLLTPAEVALLTVLMLRGPQTVGELRTRTERLFTFDTLPEVEESLAALAAREPQPLVAKLPRQPGAKESRYTHLLAGPLPAASGVPAAPAAVEAGAPVPGTEAGPSDGERIARLEEEVARLGRELAQLHEQFAEFRKSFD